MGRRERLLGRQREQPREEVVRHYAIDGRPAELRDVDGRLRLFVLDPSTGSLVPDSALTPVEVEAFDPVGAAEFEHLLGLHRADLVRRFAERLCGSAFANMPAVLDALDVPLDPAPLGAYEVDPDDRFEPTLHFRFRTPSRITKALVDARLGEAQELPRLHPDSTRTFAYDVSVADAPFSVTLFVDFRWDHDQSTGAAEISFRVHEPRQLPEPVPAPPGVETRPCPNCAWQNAVDAAFCGKCAVYLAW